MFFWVGELISCLKFTFRHPPGSVQWTLTYFRGSGRSEMESKSNYGISRLLDMMGRGSWYPNNVFRGAELISGLKITFLDTIQGGFSEPGPEKAPNPPNAVGRKWVRSSRKFWLKLKCLVHLYKKKYDWAAWLSLWIFDSFKEYVIGNQWNQ